MVRAPEKFGNHWLRAYESLNPALSLASVLPITFTDTFLSVKLSIVPLYTRALVLIRVENIFLTYLFLDVGHVWVFGCGLFGQLGNGENKKRTSPIRVDFKQTLHWEGIDDRMAIIAAGYFHNLAVSEDGLRLYMWGCNPQVCDFFQNVPHILSTSCCFALTLYLSRIC